MGPPFFSPREQGPLLLERFSGRVVFSTRLPRVVNATENSVRTPAVQGVVQCSFLCSSVLLYLSCLWLDLDELGQRALFFVARFSPSGSVRSFLMPVFFFFQVCVFFWGGAETLDPSPAQLV